MYAKHEMGKGARGLRERLVVSPEQQVTAERLVTALDRAMDTAQPELPGLRALVPLAADYLDPEGIHVVWIFDTHENLSKALQTGGGRLLYQLTATALREARMQVDNVEVNVHFDSDEACRQENQGNWQARLSILYYPARELDIPAMKRRPNMALVPGNKP